MRLAFAVPLVFVLACADGFPDTATLDIGTSFDTSTSTSTSTSTTWSTTFDTTISVDSLTDGTTTSTTGTTTEDPTTGAPPSPARQYDLDDDGQPDTDLSLGTCTQSADLTCLRVGSDLVPVLEVSLGPLPDQCDGNLFGAPRITLIGDHDGDGLSEVAARHCRFDGVQGPPALAVVSLPAAAVSARADAPAVQDNAWSDDLRDPQGLLHPFLAPSYGDGENPLGDWGRLCVYRPDLPPGDGCGPGFSAISTLLAPGEFREVGGTLQDLDGDGWEDINLIYHRRQHTVSAATLALVNDLEYDVAAASEPQSPKWFHSGRNYGTHAAVVGGDGQQRLVVVGGAPVGSFGDDLCNVSRFLAVLESSPGQPATRKLAWSTYFSFSSSIFKTYDPVHAGDPMADVARLADAVDGCIHRYADSRTVMDGQEVLLVNYFAMDAPVDLCLDEQFALYQPPTWTDEKADAWYGCFAKNKQASGKWGMQVVDERTGQGLTGSQQTYVWGWSDQLRPGELVYLVEYLPPTTLWDLSDVAPSALQVQALEGGLWQSRGTFPVAGRPKLQQRVPTGAQGVGSYTSFAELTLHPGDPPGVELEDGTVIAHDPVRDAWIVR
ncbi:hypothetical protein [Nannocystis punicea]|uniref:Repeat domain-containing protein n=1 Tax=Nannocystis punicea TaxID=2995304 RepID=A0ABY7GTB0_9BACT|nr:hypothetical protein [Nannocystis poenicansa]WAS90186.1 hypothetical protein O0S08_28665 [Nannocystis poenicansa]